MRARCWHGKADVRVSTYVHQDLGDAVIEINSCAVCGFAFDRYQPTMKRQNIEPREYQTGKEVHSRHASGD